MREYKGIQYWSCDDHTEEEMEAIHSMAMDDKSKEVRRSLFKRKNWDKLAWLFKKDGVQREDTQIETQRQVGHSQPIP